MTENIAYRDPVPEELIDGKLVAMSPSPRWNHMSIAGNLYNLFFNYLKDKTCTPIQDGFDLYLSEKDRFIPDMMVVCDRSKIQSDGVHGAPDLVVEILSPSTAKRDKTYKKDSYEAHGVPEYWIVDPMNQLVEIYLLQNGNYVLDNIHIHYPDYVLKSMTEEEKAAMVTEFRCHLYDDLAIPLEDVFHGLI